MCESMRLSNKLRLFSIILWFGIGVARMHLIPCEKTAYKISIVHKFQLLKELTKGMFFEINFKINGFYFDFQPAF